MKFYIGTKTIKAMPMVKSEAEKVLNKNLSDAKGGEEGYFVEYEDGSQSWSPKEIFEATYRLADTYVDRLFIEYEELKKRTLKLYNFILSDLFYDIDINQQDLLIQQYHAMLEYVLLINKRIYYLNLRNTASKK